MWRKYDSTADSHGRAPLSGLSVKIMPNVTTNFWHIWSTITWLIVWHMCFLTSIRYMTVGISGAACKQSRYRNHVSDLLAHVLPWNCIFPATHGEPADSSFSRPYRASLLKFSSFCYPYVRHGFWYSLPFPAHTGHGFWYSFLFLPMVSCSWSLKLSTFFFPYKAWLLKHSLFMPIIGMVSETLHFPHPDMLIYYGILCHTDWLTDWLILTHTLFWPF